MHAQGVTRWSASLSTERANAAVVRAVARALAAGEPAFEAMVARCARTLGREWRWLGPLALRYAARFEDGVRPRQRAVVRFLEEDAGFRRACLRHAKALRVVELVAEPQTMLPVRAAERWELPKIETVGGLAGWLGVTVGKLEWFADLKALLSKSGRARGEDRLGHYRYRVLAKGLGTVRLIEAPKERLKDMQRRILSEMLERIPAHPAVHGFVKGRSIRTFAAPHLGRRVVLRMDLRNFFPTFPAARVQAFFRTAGYPEAVADRLGGLCTTSAPLDVWRACQNATDADAMRQARLLYRRRHLPQGAPTSPALANLCTYRLDCRLSGLAEAAGARYTRYADDLAFSGDEQFERGVERFALHVAAVLMEEGFTVHHRKTRIMRQGVRQYLAGLVTNERLHVPRGDFEMLKAELTNCARLGAASQNRAGHPAYRAHLEGRVGFVESISAERGAKLRSILSRITW